MFQTKRIPLGAALVAASVGPAWADDCTQPKAALMVTATTPYSETIVVMGPGGKPLTSHMVQTATTKYVERNGSWTSLPVTSSELVDTLNEMIKTAKMTCKRGGTEQVNGQSATVYTMHVENQGSVTDGTLWISGQNRQLKSDMNVDGRQFTATFDYDHVQPPAASTPLGQR